MEELNKIEEQFNKIVNLITNSDTYKKYLILQDELKNNKKINNLVCEIKKNQKEIVNKEYFKEDTNNIEKELKKLYDELNKIPLFIEYNECIKKLDEEQVLIKEKINNYFDTI